MHDENQRRNLRVLDFVVPSKTGGPTGRGHSVVTQRDLEEFFLLKRHLDEARAEFKAKQLEIAALAAAGAAVEPGIHFINLNISKRLIVR